MYYRQPRYWNSFQCVGGECVDNCCARPWSIEWSEAEINKLKNAPDCSEELKKLCESSFIYNEQRKKYLVILGEKNRCPFLTEDNFCRIQRELGAEYLGITCICYPRQNMMIGDVVNRHCTMSCPEVMHKLLNDEKSTDLVNVKITKAPAYNVKKLDTPEDVKKHPEYKYAAEIKDFFYEIIANKKLPLESCIILGALAAQSLTKLVGIGDYNAIPEAIKTLRSQMHDAAQLKNIENIKPNYNIKLGVTDKLFCEFFKSPVEKSLVDGEGKPNIDYYIRAEYLLNKEFESRPFAWRNLALNFILEFNVPFKLKDSTIFENYSIFVSAYAFMRYNTVTIMSLEDRLKNTDKPINDIESYILRLSTTISRLLCHNTQNLEMILASLKDLKMTSPAYLALLVK